MFIPCAHCRDWKDLRFGRFLSVSVAVFPKTSVTKEAEGIDKKFLLAIFNVLVRSVLCASLVKKEE